jgi:hypothetical protein
MMRARRAAGVVVILLLSPQVHARQPQAQPPPATQAKPETQAPPPTAESLGVSLKNIRKQVPETSPSQPTGSGLRYDFFVDVFGKRPAIEFFKDFDLSKGGAVKWGGVTHQEILNAVTPYPFRLYTGGIELLGGKKK